MPRRIRIEYPGAIYHVLSRGDRGRDIFRDEVDRQDFLKTLAEACRKARFEVHAYCLMRNHFHLVIETPEANLVEGMRWLLSSYTLRLNHRQQRFGHVFSGRYKALVVDGSGTGYLKTVCDYVHLNPVRARLLSRQERLLAYPWSSFGWYLAAPEHRPAWLRVDRLLGEHGIGKDTAAGRAEFERRLEARRAQEADEAEYGRLRRGWCFGREEFRQELLRWMETRLGDYHAGELRRESAEAKAELLIAQQLRRLGWANADLEQRPKGDPRKLALGTRLRRETTLPVKWIARRLHLGTWKSAAPRLRAWARKEEGRER